MNGYVNYDDALGQIRAYGLHIDEGRLAFDARIQRWKVDGEDAEKRGWTRLRDWTSAAGHTYIVGSFGVWHGNDDGKVKIELPRKDDPNRPAVSAEDLAAMRAAQKEADKKLAEVRKAEAKRAATWAALVWSRCEPATEHEYLTRKGIRPNGARVMGPMADVELPEIDKGNRWRLDQAVGALVVPMHDAHGNVCGIQFIYPKGHPRREKTDKEFWPSGMAMGGTFGVIGHLRRDGLILIAEGFATAATLHEATGQTVVYAFAAGNLAKAGKELRKTMTSARLLFCADDDYLSDGNPGVTAATRACAELERAAWLAPDFLDDAGADRRNGKKLTDFNDLAVLTGLPVVVANQINAKLDALDWRDPPLVAAGSSQPGGGDSGGRRSAKSIMALDELVERFVPLDDGTGKYVFDNWTRRIAHRDQVTALLPAGMRGDHIKQHPVWIERGGYYLDQVGFDPAGDDPSVSLNTWRGWPRQPQGGDCTIMLELLRHHCGGEKNADEIYHWMLCWMAWPLQNPGAKLASAIILQGPQGGGKSTIWKALAWIYGDGDPSRNYSVILDQKALQSDFNSDWESKTFVLAEEVVNSSDKWQLKNELKELVTGGRIRINRKFVDAFYQTNRINMVFLSNEDAPLPLDNDDRRHLVLWTPPPPSDQFFDELYAEIDRGGYAAFYRYLLDYDCRDFHPKKRPPMTAAKGRLIDMSTPSEKRFLRDWVQGDTDLPICPCVSMDLYAAYQRWCRQHGENRPRSSPQFLGALQNMHGWEKRKARFYATEGATQTVMKPIVFPPSGILQAEGAGQRDGESQEAWLTRSVLAFAEAGDAEIKRFAA